MEYSAAALELRFNFVVTQLKSWRTFRRHAGALFGATPVRVVFGDDVAPRWRSSDTSKIQAALRFWLNTWLFEEKTQLKFPRGWREIATEFHYWSFSVLSRVILRSLWNWLSSLISLILTEFRNNLSSRQPPMDSIRKNNLVRISFVFWPKSQLYFHSDSACQSRVRSFDSKSSEIRSTPHNFPTLCVQNRCDLFRGSTEDFSKIFWSLADSKSFEIRSTPHNSPLCVIKIVVICFVGALKTSQKYFDRSFHSKSCSTRTVSDLWWF